MADAGGVRAGKVFVEIGANDTALMKALRAAQKRLENFGKSVVKVGAGLAGIGGATLTPLLAMSKSFSDAGGKLQDMSLRTGASVEALSTLEYAAAQTGAAFTDVETGIKKTQKAITEAAAGGKSQAAVFDELGLSVEALAAMNTDEQFRTVAKAIAAVEDPTKRATLAMQVWGKSGTLLIPLAQEWNSLERDIKSLGGVMTGEMAKAAKTLGDRLTDLQVAGAALTNQIGFALSGTLTELTAKLTATVKVVGDMVLEHKSAIITMAKWAAGLTIAGTALASLGGAALLVGKGIGAIVTVMGLARTATMLLTGANIAQTASNYALATSAATAQAITGAGILKVLAGVAVAGIAAGAIEKLAATYGYLTDEVNEAAAAQAQASATMGRTPGGQAGAAAVGEPANDRASNESIRALHEARLKNIEDENNRELNLAIFRGENEIKRAREAGANDATLQTMRLTLAENLGQLERSQAQKTHDEKVQQAKELADKEEQRLKHIAELEERRGDSIAELQLQASFKGDELKRQELALAKEIALREARAAGESLELVEKEYDLRSAILEKEIAERKVNLKMASADTYGSSAALGSINQSAIDRGVALQLQQAGAVMAKVIAGQRAGANGGKAGAAANTEKDDGKNLMKKLVELTEDAKRYLRDIERHTRKIEEVNIVKM